MIPRIIHWLWLGPDPVPGIFTHYFDSWRRHHPSWDLRTWRDDTLPPLSCQAECAQASFKLRYDIVRLELVRQFGGVILDMDVEAIRPIDPLLVGVSGFIGRIGSEHVGNQVLGAVPQHPFFTEAVARLRATVGGDDSTSDTAGKGFLKKLLAEHPEGMTVFPPETFHFQPSFEPPKRPDDFPRVYAVHHELATYATPPSPSDIEQAIANLMSAAAAPAGGYTPRQLAKLQRCERRLRRELQHQERGYAALMRRVEAEREQAEVRHRSAQRQLAALEQQPGGTPGQTLPPPAGLVAWARRLLTRRVPS
jgi:hypothetical protein